MVNSASSVGGGGDLVGVGGNGRGVGRVGHRLTVPRIAESSTISDGAVSTETAGASTVQE